MSDIFELTNNYRKEFLDVLGKNNSRYGVELVSHVTNNGKYTVPYYRWLHPYQGNWEKTEIFTDEILSFLESILDANSVVLDVGAQAGLMSVAFSLFGSKVISFEPNPAAYEVVEANAKLFPKITPYNLACSKSEGIEQFHYSDDGLCNGGFATACETGIGVTGHTVPMDVYTVNLNDFINTYHANDIDNIKLIKIDAEGHDKEIIRTIYPLLDRVKPILIAEMYAGLVRSEIIDLLSSITDASYEIYDISKNNSGLGDVKYRRKINSINDVKVGELCNFLCLPTK